jgi:hypothetical protein
MMARSRRTLALVAGMVLACTAGPADATATRAYDKADYPVIDGGEAPNKRLALAAHGNGELGNEGFHLYLMAEPGHRRLAKLDSIDSNNTLDWAPDAFHALWAADSGHVAIFFRSSRHELTMLIYAVRNGRGHLVGGPALLDQMMKGAALSARDFRLREDVTELTWLDATRFTLKERGVVSFEKADLAAKLGAFGKAQQDAGGGNATDTTFVEFSVEAAGELAAGDNYRVRGLKPGAFAR